MSALWVYVAPSGEGGRLAAKPPDGARTWDRGNKSRCSVLIAGFSWQGSHGKSPLSGDGGGRLAAKPQTGRGLGTAETNLVAAFS